MTTKDGQHAGISEVSSLSASIPLSSPFSQDLSITTNLNEGLRVCHFNANSLRARIESLRLFLTKRPYFHIIAITETKLGSIVDDSLVSLNGYTLLRQDRKTTGGVVALFVHNSLSVSRLQSSSGKWAGKPGLPEYLFCNSNYSKTIKKTQSYCFN